MGDIRGGCGARGLARQVGTPANWHPGDDVMPAMHLAEAEHKGAQEKSVPSGRSALVRTNSEIALSQVAVAGLGGLGWRRGGWLSGLGGLGLWGVSTFQVILRESLQVSHRCSLWFGFGFGPPVVGKPPGSQAPSRGKLKCGASLSGCGSLFFVPFWVGNPVD